MASIVRPEPASGSAPAASDGAITVSVSIDSFSENFLAAGDDAALTDGEATVPTESFSGKVLVAGDATAGAGAAGGAAVVVGGAAPVAAGGGDAAAVALNGLAALRGRLR